MMLNWFQAEVRKKEEEREEEERRKTMKIKDINRMEQKEKELLLQIYSCKVVDAKSSIGGGGKDTDGIKNNKEKGLSVKYSRRNIYL